MLQLSEKLKSFSSWSLTLDPNDPDKQSILFQYPTITGTGTFGYVKPQVKIEFGARAELWPFNKMSIRTYLYEVFNEPFLENEVELKILSAERTFWEKVTLLHELYHRPSEKGLPQRMSRHYYDTYMLAKSPFKVTTLADRELF